MNSSFYGKRLQTVAGLVPTCNTLADIGTDHGFLAIGLLQSGKIKKAICTDINESPLNSARKNISIHCPDANVDFRLGNGTEVLNPCEADCICIAGMGGDLIADILIHDTSSPALYVIQPMTKEERMRLKLYENGFSVFDWRLCVDSGRLYPVLSVCRGKDHFDSKYDSMFGSYSVENAELYPRYLAEKKFKFSKALDGLRKSKTAAAPQITELEQMLITLERLEHNICR